MDDDSLTKLMQLTSQIGRTVGLIRDRDELIQSLLRYDRATRDEVSRASGLTLAQIVEIEAVDG